MRNSSSTRRANGCRPLQDPDRIPRALFILISDLPGGAERVACTLASEIASKPGWEAEVLVACSRHPDSFTGRALDPRVRVLYGRLSRWHLAYLLLPLRLAFRRYDLIFTTHIYTNALASAMRRVGLLRTGKLIMRESMALFDRYSGLKAVLFDRLYRCYGGEDLLIVQTSYMADHVRPRLPRRSAARLQLLPNPVAFDAIQRASSEPLEPELSKRLEGKKNILFCGRLVDFKRPMAALEVFERLAAEDDLVQLIFLGTGPLESEVRREAARLGLTDRVLFLGLRPNPYPVMAACQYGLVTSANEGFPNVVLEMMASGIGQIVMTPCAGDLECLAGVAISPGFAVADIASVLRQVIRSSADQRASYRKVAAERSPKAYVDAVLTSRRSGSAPGIEESERCSAG